VLTGEITLLSLIHTCFLFSFFIKLLIRLGLASPSLSNKIEMVSSVSLTLFMSHPTDCAKDGEITKSVPQSVSRRACCGKLASTALCSCLAANCANESCFGGMNAYSIHWQTHFHNYMRHNTPFYTFNKDSIEHVLQVEEGHGECLRLCLSNMTSHSKVFRRF